MWADSPLPSHPVCERHSQCRLHVVGAADGVLGSPRLGDTEGVLGLPCLGDTEGVLGSPRLGDTDGVLGSLRLRP